MGKEDALWDCLLDPEQEEARKAEQAKELERIQEEAFRQSRKLAEEKARMEASREEGLALLPVILAEAERGTPRLYALVSAVRCIGLLTDNPEWANKVISALGPVEELEKEGRYAEALTMAEEKTDEIRSKYATKLEKSLKANMKTLDMARAEMEEALKTVEAFSIF